jgi:hypothetical protein
MEAVTKELFEEWKFHPVTKKLFKLMEEDRENMKEMLVHGVENEAEVRGRCKILGSLLNLQYEDMQPPQERKVENEYVQ